MMDRDLARSILQWYAAVGVDEAIGEAPRNRLAESPPPTPPSTARTTDPAADSHPRTASDRPRSAGDHQRPPPMAIPEALQSAVALARGADSLESLRQAVERFDGCALKSSAMNTVFADGTPHSRVMFLGEAPGAEEDRQGLPFVGPSGRLLDQMLESIGLSRKLNAYISNIIFWRPPGNRTPTVDEVALCRPFVERHVELLDPDMLIFLGAPAATSMLGRKEGISKLRGHWFEYESPGMSRPIPARALFHPAYLLRSPIQKRLAWLDLLSIKERLDQ